jgi:hypothetical protein
VRSVLRIIPLPLSLPDDDSRIPSIPHHTDKVHDRGAGTDGQNDVEPRASRADVTLLQRIKEPDNFKRSADLEVAVALQGLEHGAGARSAESIVPQ